MASGRGPDNIVLPVVGECDDGDLADSRTVVAGDVDAALAALGDDVAEGTVGGGTGHDMLRRSRAGSEPPRAVVGDGTSACC